MSKKGYTQAELDKMLHEHPLITGFYKRGSQIRFFKKIVNLITDRAFICTAPKRTCIRYMYVAKDGQLHTNVGMLWNYTSIEDTNAIDWFMKADYIGMIPEIEGAETYGNKW